MVCMCYVIVLKVSLDLAKLIYAFFINWDIQMYDNVRSTPAFAANTAISEDLGQVIPPFPCYLHSFLFRSSA
jgi:hypothetical protein